MEAPTRLTIQEAERDRLKHENGYLLSRMIESEVTLLPDPDSPTIATVSPGETSKEMSRTTGFQAPSTRNEVVRFSTERTGAVERSC